MQLGAVLFRTGLYVESELYISQAVYDECNYAVEVNF